VYFSNWYTFLIKALSPLLNGTLQYHYIVAALKMVCFCLETSEMYQEQNMKIGEKKFRNIFFA